MPRPDAISPQLVERLHEALGYLNFSSGAHEPRFLRNLNELYAALSGSAEPAKALGQRLAAGIEDSLQRPSALGDARQAEAVLRLTFDVVLPGYLEFHRDLLFHQSPAALYTPLFIGRVCQAVLAEGSPWEEAERITAGAIRRLNDYLGYRPIAQHRSDRRGEAYPHERVRPVPLFIADVGVDLGRYREVVAIAFDILRACDPRLLQRAWFDLTLLEELAYDPRAYDFDHPVHKRPNHHFGQWDLDRIDNRGFYRRFVVQQVTLDALCSRIDEPQPRRRAPKPTRDEMLFEAASVLAGTMLMGSGTTGNGPDCHDSTVTLANLLPRIAAYRDEFYDDLLARMTGAHGERLRAEAAQLKQPFGGARQHLNGRLARLRATQLEHVHVAQAFAAMGFPDSARKQAAVVPVASARMLCEMNCRLTACERDLGDGHETVPAPTTETAQSRQRVTTIQAAAEQVRETEELLHRAIQCGAMIDPWNITWFSAQFGLFRALEDSVYDHRADQLIELLERIFIMYARLVSEAFSSGDEPLGQALLERMGNLAQWWDRFATASTSSVESFSGREMHESAAHVGEALAAWHQGGSAAGDVAFWRRYVAEFHSPRTFARVVEALLEKHDFVAAMALLVQWVAQAPSVPLEEGDDSFHELVAQWMRELLESDLPDRRRAARKLLDFLEANADEYWDPPSLSSADGEDSDRILRRLFGGASDSPDATSDDEDDDDADEGENDDDEEGGASDLFGAAYEGVVFRDSALDGVEGEVADSGALSGTDYEFEEELKRITDRLAFLSTVSGLWKHIALDVARCSVDELAGGNCDIHDALRHWRDRAGTNRERLLGLLSTVQRFRVASPSGTFDSQLEYDRRRSMKEQLLDRIIAASVDTTDAVQALSAILPAADSDDSESFPALAARIDRALVAGKPAVVAGSWEAMLSALRRKTSLYQPLARGGDPLLMAEARVLHQRLRQWLAWLPRLGMLAQTFELIETIRVIEVEHPVGPGAVTEFDRLFETGYKAVVDAVVLASRDWGAGASNRAAEAEGMLNEALQTVAEPFLVKWLAHSQTLRLAALERIDTDADWRELKTFIERYGRELFTQQFMNLGNLRAILHQGADNWLRRLEEEPDLDGLDTLMADLAGPLVRSQAARHLTVILEAIVDNYTEYRDYNSTTTQSDRGEMLYTFLDFLRLKASYERAFWNLRPVIMAHEVLVRRGCGEAAQLWRRALVERTGDVAERLVRQLERLQKQYGMRLPTVADRVCERFVRPLDVDRVLALVRPSIEELRAGNSTTSFAQLEAEVARLTEEPTGAGLDLPDWLAALEDEVDMVRHAERRSRLDEDQDGPVPRLPMTFEEALRQAREMI